MSATSTKIFGNDMALDVKDDFKMLLGVGKNIGEIEKYILDYRPDDDDEEACAFWSSLALMEWEYGLLSELVKEKAQYVIQNNNDIFLFKDEKDQQLRKSELQKLLEKLGTENESPKKIKKTFVFRTDWKTGDVLAIQIGNRYAYLHVCAVIRESKKIKELEEDEIYVRVFDIISDEVLAVNRFKKRFFKCIKYKNIDRYRKCLVKQLWCMGVREKTSLEKTVICIGNIPTQTETSRFVSADFQFCKIENTLKNLFEIKDYDL